MTVDRSLFRPSPLEHELRQYRHQIGDETSKHEPVDLWDLWRLHRRAQARRRRATLAIVALVIVALLSLGLWAGI